MKRLRGLFLRLLLVLASVELASFVALSVLDRALFSYGRTFAQRAGIAGSQAAAPEAGGEHGTPATPEATQSLMRIRDQVLHPYVGYVFDPAFNSPGAVAELGGREITDYGFIGTGELFEPPGEDRVVVAITGGSVAVYFSIWGLETLVEELKRAPELADKEIVFVTLALLGYKQPQQLFALAYALSLGAGFDWVVNLDGFNEVALPPVENVPKGVAAIFPRSWFWRVEDAPDPELRRAMGRIDYLEEARVQLARRFSARPFCYSVTWNLVWRVGDLALAKDIARAEARLVEHRPEAVPFVARGPVREYGDERELYEDLAEIWARSSLQMHRLCRGNGIRYYHFLQPNQYVEGSKTMSAAERRLALSDESPFKRPVEQGYPLLREAGEGLRAAGVGFHDLTGVFAGVGEPLYFDNCCHFNEEGNRVLARTIAAAILDDLRAADESR